MIRFSLHIWCVKIYSMTSHQQVYHDWAVVYTKRCWAYLMISFWLLVVLCDAIVKRSCNHWEFSLKFWKVQTHQLERIFHSSVYSDSKLFKKNENDKKKALVFLCQRTISSRNSWNVVFSIFSQISMGIQNPNNLE